MRLKFLNFLAFTLISFYAIAQTGNVSGHVFIEVEPGIQDFMPGYPVTLVLANDIQTVIETVTDDNGAYSIDFEIPADADPVATVGVFDFCFGETITEELANSGSTAWVADITMCRDNSIDPPVACDAYFIDMQTSVDPYIVSFTDVSYTEPAATSWAWDFGDGDTSDEQNPTHEYAAAGGYDVSFTVTNDSCTSTIVYGILVQDNIEDCICTEEWAPVCVVGVAGDTITFPNLCYAECEGFTAADVFDCGWTNPCECTDEWAPVCVLTPNGSIIDFPNACWAECEGYTIEDFVDCEPGGCVCTDEYDPVCVLTPDGFVIDFINPCWAECAGYGEDSYVECEGDCECTDEWAPVCVEEFGIIRSFPNACWAACEGFTEEDFVVCENVDNCYADFYTGFNDVPGNNGLEVDFIDASNAYEGEVISWSWNFGDGETSNEQNPTHTYAEGGIYDVTLTIETSDDCTSTTTLHICIGNGGGYEGPDCQSMFFFSQTDVEGFAFAFEDVSIGEPVAWTWDFGDGESSDEQNPAHTYAQGGLYLVTLNITTANGDCTSSTTMPVFANEDAFYEDECWALFIPFIDSESNTVFFLNLSSHEDAETHWDFGDGTTSDELFFAFHEYADGGTYTVTLNITTAEGCESSFEATVNIQDDEFTGNPQYSLTTGTDDVKAIAKINTYPNPVANTLNIEFNMLEAGAYTINLTAIDGRTIQTSNGQAVKGINTTAMNTRALPQGIYFVNIQSGTATTTFRVVKD